MHIECDEKGRQSVSHIYDEFSSGRLIQFLLCMDTSQIRLHGVSIRKTKQTKNNWKKKSVDPTNNMRAVRLLVYQTVGFVAFSLQPNIQNVKARKRMGSRVIWVCDRIIRCASKRAMCWWVRGLESVGRYNRVHWLIFMSILFTILNTAKIT